MLTRASDPFEAAMATEEKALKKLSGAFSEKLFFVILAARLWIFGSRDIPPGKNKVSIV